MCNNRLALLKFINFFPWSSGCSATCHSITQIPVFIWSVPLQVGVEIAPLYWNVLNNFVLFTTITVHFLFEIIFSLAIVFLVQWNTWHRIFGYQGATENFITKARFFLILPCLSSTWIIAIDCHSGDQTDGDEGSWQSPFFAALHTSCGNCVLQAQKCFIDYVMKRHSAKSALGAFVAVWKVWLSQRLGYLRHVGRIGYWLRGRCGRGRLIWQYQCLYWAYYYHWHMLAQVLKTMICALVSVGIWACIGLYWIVLG